MLYVSSSLNPYHNSVDWFQGSGTGENEAQRGEEMAHGGRAWDWRHSAGALLSVPALFLKVVLGVCEKGSDEHRCWTGSAEMLCLDCIKNTDEGIMLGI